MSAKAHMNLGFSYSQTKDIKTQTTHMAFSSNFGKKPLAKIGKK